MSYTLFFSLSLHRSQFFSKGLNQYIGSVLIQPYINKDTQHDWSQLRKNNRTPSYLHHPCFSKLSISHYRLHVCLFKKKKAAATVCGQVTLILGSKQGTQHSKVHCESLSAYSISSNVRGRNNHPMSKLKSIFIMPSK